VLNIKYVLVLFSNFFVVQNISNSKTNATRYYRKCILVGLWSARYYARILPIFENCSKYFRKKKILKNKVSWKCVQWGGGGRGPSCCTMRMDRQTDTMNLKADFFFAILRTRLINNMTTESVCANFVKKKKTYTENKDKAVRIGHPVERFRLNWVL